MSDMNVFGRVDSERQHNYHKAISTHGARLVEISSGLVHVVVHVTRRND